jgi:uncharacterized protein YndB with AHSA1/START domain
MADSNTLTIRHRFAASPERVFDAWLDPATAGRWLFATPGGKMERVEIDPRVGGGFVIAERRGETLVEHFGTYMALDRPHRLVFDFVAGKADGTPTRMILDFAAVAGGCEATLSFDLAPEWLAFRDRTVKGWTMILDGLGRSLGA